ncbi:hypothetical protein ES319_A10G116000v1 [Gossypium barbadense]|uniref:DUF2828 domain-containing protein n=2 Tax=Gossypium TaxID=3633 RepID=A0A2P5WLA7_GOSBA|nr:hypothetical protein ES319_A10G116000v1 [Gossypium barbadense]PPR91866.1 hypothetical protein GOBAR_AA28822 [Gossypium barbadense]TYG98552.1 hypothetical protein ES288_A10G126500v1 [Gossypium darwinii]
MISTIVGPPAIHTLNPPSTAVIDVESLAIQAGDCKPTGEPPRGRTENNSATFLSTGNPCLDFFFHVVPDNASHELIERLELAWAHDSLTALKLICNLRGVRGTGKSDKEGFYTAVLWLFSKHPKTLAFNLKAISEFGYFKDFPEILYRILEGPESRKIQRMEWQDRKRGGKRSSKKIKNRGKFKQESNEKVEASEKKFEGVLENVEEMGRGIDKEKARALRKEREKAKAKKAFDKYYSDSNYRLLFDCVAEFFADCLKSDFKKLNDGKLFAITLAAKWCPSIDSSYDKATLICEAIARRVFPRESEKEFEGLEEAHYAYRFRDRLRKQVLVPLHKVLQLPEVYMSANKWNSLPYNRVPSVAMKTYKELFKKHDKERFREYLERVKTGKAKIAAGALLPHEIIASLEDEDGGAVAELQWKRMVEDVGKKGKLTNCIAVCDVSGSMFGIPMDVAVAMGLLVSELSEEPWKGKVMTFSANPQLHLVKGDSLKAKTEFVRKMEVGFNTDFQKVFDEILAVAVEGKLSEEQLIRRLFVFSDMEFDDACGNYSKYMNMESVCNDDEEEPDYEVLREKMKECGGEMWKTDYEVIKEKFQKCGYKRVPKIVFWNLRNSSSTPVVATQDGVALVSGYSKNLLTLFLDEGGIVNPEQVMELAIAGGEYKKLVIHD